MTFKDALHIMSTNLFLKIILPNWAMNFTKHTRMVDMAFSEIKVRYSIVSTLPFSSILSVSSSNTCWKWWKLAGMPIKENNAMIYLVAF